MEAFIRSKARIYRNSLVSFADLAKTLLSITGCEIPGAMKGHIFLGKDMEEEPEHVFFYRDRMAERIDFCGAVTAQALGLEGKPELAFQQLLTECHEAENGWLSWNFH